MRVNKNIIISSACICTYFVLTAAILRNEKNRGLGSPFISKFRNVSLPKTELFFQKLDHFNPTDETVWSQRYWENAEFYKPNGPAFLMISGEATANASWITSGRWMLYAKNHEAMCFLLEHRFYGESRPTNDTSTDNLKYLNSEQALADAAYFIQGMNKKHNFSLNVKWIVFGGSYAGSLAAWLRLKYPHLVYGAVSSSGPLLAKVDFFEYYQVVRDSLSSYNNSCVEEVKLANLQLNNLLKTDSDRSKIKEMFMLCDELDDDENDISSLFENLADNFAGVVQYNKDNKISSSSFLTIDLLCDIMISDKFNKNSSSIIRYAAVNKLLLKAYNKTCLSHKYSDNIEVLKKTDWKNSNDAGRQWFYQTCTEFGFYQTSSRSNHIFGNHFPVQYFIKQCKDVFGSRFNESLLNDGVSRTNMIYGGLKIHSSNIVYVHGSIDPWHALGILNSTINDNYKAIFIEGTAHCADVYPASPKDSPNLTHAIKLIQHTIRSWLHKKYVQEHVKPKNIVYIKISPLLKLYISRKYEIPNSL